MDKHLDTRFDRVEKALGTLIDSIIKYNPSLAQVQDLGNADAELKKGLKDCMFMTTTLPCPPPRIISHLPFPSLPC
jgi:hypothetical protein